jgi:hypothetical protein
LPRPPSPPSAEVATVAAAPITPISSPAFLANDISASCLIAGTITRTTPAMFRLLLHAFGNDDAVKQRRLVVALL